MSEVLSIGHSTLEYPEFEARLRAWKVTAVADVRTVPFSRHFPQFNRDALKSALKRDGIAYVNLGAELGGRPKSREYYSDGVADYEKMATAPEFVSGLQRVAEGAAKYRIALMCSERDPLSCHRCLLVGRALLGRSFCVRHILSDSESVTQEEVEQRLLEMAGKGHNDMFEPSDRRLSHAYRDRARRVAFSEDSEETSQKLAAE